MNTATMTRMMPMTTATMAAFFHSAVYIRQTAVV